MPKLFCMCGSQGGRSPIAYDGQVYGAPNRWRRYKGMLSVMLSKPMKVFKTGMEQYLPFICSSQDLRNRWPETDEAVKEDIKNAQFARRHYPDVDVYECPNCHSKICVE